MCTLLPCYFYSPAPVALSKSAAKCFTSPPCLRACQSHTRSSHRGCTLSAWLWWLGDNCIFRTHGSEIDKRDDCQVTIPRAAHIDQNIPPSLPMKKVCLLVLKIQPEGQASSLHTSNGYESALRECRLRDAIFVFFFGLMTAYQYLWEVSSYIHQELQFLQLSQRGYL